MPLEKLFIVTPIPLAGIPLRILMFSCLVGQLLTQSGAAFADTESDAELLFNWAEEKFPSIFAAHKPTAAQGPWIYRHYSETGVYAGVNRDDSNVYVMGGPWGNSPTVVGSLTQLMQRVNASIPRDCSSSNPPRSATANAPTIIWDTSATSIELELGSSLTHDIPFISNVDIVDLQFALSGDLADVVDISPTIRNPVKQCQSAAATLTFRTPANQQMGRLSGTLLLSEGSRPLAQPVTIDVTVGIPFRDDVSSFLIYLPSVPDVEVITATTEYSGLIKTYVLSGIEGVQNEIIIDIYQNQDDVPIAAWYESNKEIVEQASHEGFDASVNTTRNVNGLDAIFLMTPIFDITSTSTYFSLTPNIVRVSTQFTDHVNMDDPFFSIIDTSQREALQK